MGFGNDVSDMTPKGQTTKAKIDKWDYINLKNFCTSKENNQQNGDERKYWQITYLIRG